MSEGRITTVVFCEAGGVTMVRDCGFLPLVVGGYTAIPVHGTGFFTQTLVMLR
jgi:hypothetical protein